ncbi:MAG: indole-3-glycerol phosphate synthase TrpC [Candidatus Limivivens sp.]|nr:indole-3-glycerol phosphate synthase TrpC [Candidatus Limivivens sp.]
MILQEIAENTRRRLVSIKQEKSLAEVRREAESLPADTGFPLEEALKKPGISFICEVKKASPSKGVIVQDFPYLQIAEEYETAGADAVSVLTEPDYFQGSPAYLKEISGAVAIPTLRKDFVVDAYQIFEAKVLGASAVLLISELLEKEQLREYLQICRSLGLSALTEAHSREQVEKALEAGAVILGVNNRNLETFQVDMQTSVRLRHLVPGEVLFVSESGIRTRADILPLEEAGVDGVLIGETFMRSPDKKEMLDRLRGTHL